MSVAALRDQIKIRLDTIAGLTVYDVVPDQLIPPCAAVNLLSATPEQTFGRGDLTDYRFEVQLYVSGAGGIRNAQDRIDPYLATSSTGGIYGAIHGDRTLGGAAHGVFIAGFRDYGLKGENGELMGATVDLTVMAS